MEKADIFTDQINHAIKVQDINLVRQYIKKQKTVLEGGTIELASGLLQTVAEHSSDDTGASLVLLLVTAGAADACGEDGDAALQVAVTRDLVHTAQALLQCGVTPPETLPEQCSDSMAELVEQFRPGLWTAVAEERLGDVRRLLNLWCRVDLRRDGRTLRRLALDTGNEPIISLILNIEPTMKCAFLVLARDEDGLAELLASPMGKKVNSNFRKQSERGAPLLYFAARSGSATACRLLMERGASLGLQMRDDEGADMPLIFALLHPAISPEVIRCVLPPGVCEAGCSSPAGRQGRQLLQLVCYRCRNVLTHAVEADLAPEVVRALLEAAGPELVCERGPDNRCLAERLSGRPALLSLLRTTLTAWICGTDDPRDELLVPLLVRGCDWLEPLLAGDACPMDAGDGQERPPRAQEGLLAAGDGQKSQSAAGDVQKRLSLTGDDQENPPSAVNAPLEAEDARLSAFLQERRRVQHSVDALYRCLKEDAPEEKFDRLADQLPDQWLWHARPAGTGTPLLVSAALLSRPAAVARLARGLGSPDTVRDGFRRTALHYACGTDCQPVRRALLRAGGSEHTLDVFGREPLDFADVVGSERLEELLRMRREQEYDRSEPDPWEPEHRHRLQERRRRQRYCDPTLARHAHSHSHGGPAHSHSHGGPAHSGPAHTAHASPAYFPTAAGSDFRWPLPPDYSRASFGQSATGGATVASEGSGGSNSCVVS